MWLGQCPICGNKHEYDNCKSKFNPGYYRDAAGNVRWDLIVYVCTCGYRSDPFPTCQDLMEGAQLAGKGAVHS